MNYADNPISTLAECIAHAQYEGFSGIEYDAPDLDAIRNAKTVAERNDVLYNKTIKKTRRPTPRDFEVMYMFTQMWGSTALGHGGMGGAAMTTAYTVVLYCYEVREFLVYFGGQWCYTVKVGSKNFDGFIADCKNKCLVSKKEAIKYD